MKAHIKMKKITLLTLTAVFSLQALSNINEIDKDRVWDVKNIDNEFIWYRVPGQTVWGHKYGFIKHSLNCDADNFVIEWSSYEDMKKYEGKIIPLQLENNKGKITRIKPYLSYVNNFTDIMQVGFFTDDQSHTTSTKTFDIFNNDSDTVTISIGDEYENFDIKSDTFLTRGLKEARKKAAIKCRGLSSNFALKAV